MIEVLGMPHCMQCKMLKDLLTTKNVEFTYEENEDRVLEEGRKAGLRSVPIVLQDGVAMDMRTFVDNNKELLK